MTVPYGLLDAGQPGTGPRGPLLNDPTPPDGPQLGSPAAPSRPSLLSRVARFSPFHMNPSMAGLLSPDQKNYVESEGQRSLAASLLSASGPAPQGTENFGSRLGKAMGNVDWEGLQERMTNSMMSLNQYAIQLRRIQQRQNIVNMFPPQANETAQQTAMRYAQMLPYFIANGDTDIIGQMGEVIKNLGFDPSLYQLQEITDKNGQVHFVPINKMTGQQGGAGAQPSAGPTPNQPPTAPTSPQPGPGQPGAGAPSPMGGQPNPGGVPGVQPQVGGAPAPGGAAPGAVPGQAYQTPASLQQQTTNEQKYRQEYQGAIKDYQTRADLYKDALDRADAASRGDGIAQSELVSAAASAMSGGVQGGGRGEALLALIERSKPLYQKVKAFLNQTAGKAPLLTRDEVGEVVDLLRQKYNSNARQWSQIHESYRRGATRAHVDPSALFPTPPDTLPSAGLLRPQGGQGKTVRDSLLNAGILH